jgi:hypothetical protein
VVDAFSPAWTLAPLAPLSVAPASGPSSGGASGALVPSRAVGSDWSAKRVDGEAKVRGERRSAIERARHSVEAGWSRPGQLTKQERLAAAASKGTRDTGSLDERRSALSSVQKAMAAVNGTPSDTDISAADYRMNRDALRQRYPGRSLADMVATAEQTEAAFKDDPVAARSAIIANYARMPVENLPTYKPPVHAEGLRGSLQRARQDQADAEDLKAAEKKYGANLPQILKQLEAFDRGMINDPANTSARLATAYGAPATHEQIEPYKAAQAQKQAAAAHQQRFDTMHQGVQDMIAKGHLPGDKATLHEVVAVLRDPKFQHHPTDAAETLRRAAAIVAHPDHVRTTAAAGRSAGRRDPGSLSISGSAPSAAARYGSGSSTREAIRRALAR